MINALKKRKELKQKLVGKMIHLEEDFWLHKAGKPTLEKLTCIPKNTILKLTNIHFGDDININKIEFMNGQEKFFLYGSRCQKFTLFW